MGKSYLNIAAGKIKPIDFEPYQNFLVQLDTMYFHAETPMEVEINYHIWLHNQCDMTIHCNHDAFEFLGLYKHQFDFISCYRFLEHVKKTDVQGFIYLLSTALKVGGELDIIVPNYAILADMILNETLTDKVKHQDWERHDTELTYELLNEPSMPHASIWTPDRIKYFFTLEERFELISLDPTYEFDGRSLYIRAKMKRVK